MSTITNGYISRNNKFGTKEQYCLGNDLYDGSNKTNHLKDFLQSTKRTGSRVASSLREGFKNPFLVSTLVIQVKGLQRFRRMRFVQYCFIALEFQTKLVLFYLGIFTSLLALLNWAPEIKLCQFEN